MSKKPRGKPKGRPAGTTVPLKTTVTVECVLCRGRREIGPDEPYPICKQDGGPMFAVRATRA